VFSRMRKPHCWKFLPRTEVFPLPLLGDGRARAAVDSVRMLRSFMVAMLDVDDLFLLI